MIRQNFLKLLTYVVIICSIFYAGLYAGNYFTTKYYDKRPDKSPTFYESIAKIESNWVNSDYSMLCNKKNTYSFVVAGHTYGYPGGKFNGLYNQFVSEIKKINDCNSMKFGLFLGDIVAKASNKQFGLFKEDLGLFRDDIAKYVVPGNHDVGMGHDNAKRDIFIQNFEKTYQSFEYNQDLFVLLDANYDPWNIKGDQLKWLKKMQEDGNKYRNVFVFTHQVIWFDKNSDRARLATVKTNSLEGYPKHEGTNFWPEVFPILSSLAENSYFFAGDVGAWDNNSELFYDSHKGSHFFATGMGGGKRDNYLIVSVENGSINVIPRVFSR
jgi:hypothetical protein